MDQRPQQQVGDRALPRRLPESVAPSHPAAPLRVVLNGDRLEIQASVDLAGLKKLQVMLEKYQSILEMMQPEWKEATN